MCGDTAPLYAMDDTVSPHGNSPSAKHNARRGTSGPKRQEMVVRLALQGTLIPWQLDAEADLALEHDNQVKTNEAGAAARAAAARDAEMRRPGGEPTTRLKPLN